MLGLRFGEPQVKVDLRTLLQCPHRHSEERFVRILHGGLHVFVVSKSAACDDDPFGIETAFEACLELVEASLKQDFFLEHLLAVQVNLAIIDSRRLLLLSAGLPALAQLRLQARLNYLDQLNLLPNVIPRLLGRERLSDLPVPVLQLS